MYTETMDRFVPAPLIDYWLRALYAGKVKPLSELDFSAYKKSDTVFILGSGPSVNELTEDELAFIKRHDSIGFNMWIAHDLVPTIYESEAPDDSGILYDLWHKRASDYANVPFIVFDCMTHVIDLEKVPAIMRENMYVAETYFILGDNQNKESYKMHLQQMLNEGFFAPSNQISVLARRRSSGVLNLALALKMGYKNIILVGYDLRNYDYFHRFDALKHPEQVYPSEDGSKGVEASVVIEAIDEAVAQPMGVKISVASENSKLFPRFPLWI